MIQNPHVFGFPNGQWLSDVSLGWLINSAYGLVLLKPWAMTDMAKWLRIYTIIMESSQLWFREIYRYIDENSIVKMNSSLYEHESIISWHMVDPVDLII